MMGNFVAVAITSRAYHTLAGITADNLPAAAEIFAREYGRRAASMAVVLRDGATGKRYTVAECAELSGVSGQGTGRSQQPTGVKAGGSDD